MGEPKSKEADARKPHVPCLEFWMPVAVSLWVCSCTAVLEWTAVSATDGHLLVRRGRIQGGGVPVRVVGGAVVVVAVGRQVRVVGRLEGPAHEAGQHQSPAERGDEHVEDQAPADEQIGRASCRERVCQYV